MKIRKAKDNVIDAIIIVITVIVGITIGGMKNDKFVFYKKHPVIALLIKIIMNILILLIIYLFIKKHILKQ